MSGSVLSNGSTGNSKIAMKVTIYTATTLRVTICNHLMALQGCAGKGRRMCWHDRTRKLLNWFVAGTALSYPTSRVLLNDPGVAYSLGRG